MSARNALLAAALLATACTTEVAHLGCAEDGDCLGGARCLEGVCVLCAEREARCFDGVDEDCDGQTDCQDADCAGRVCRSAAGACDVAEFCDGASPVCPGDRWTVEGVLCRAATACGAAAACTGGSPHCPASVAAEGSQGTVCRRAEGPCGEDAVCDGVAPDCPEPAAKAAGSVCRLARGPCERDGRCDGVSSACPEVLEPAGTTCRVPTRACERAGVCDGQSPSCPEPSPVGVEEPLVCRAKAGPCDVEELCDGRSLDCPPDQLLARGLECRLAEGPCDVVERCDGMNADCPFDGVAVGIPCGAGAHACELPSVCGGVGKECPPGGPQPSGTVCRAAAGACDVAERCDGASLGCPDDALATPSTRCRAAVGACDKPEYCTGTGAACPDDALYDATRACRPIAGPCDKVEYCSGTATHCPADAFLDSATACRPSRGACDPAETCAGGAQCPTDVILDGATACRPAAGPCDAPEACDGVGFECPLDDFLPPLAPCGFVEECSGLSAGCPAAAAPSEVPTSVPAYAGGPRWYWRNPFPQGNTLRAIGGASRAAWFGGDETMLRLLGTAFTNLAPPPLPGAIRSIAGSPGDLWAVGDGGMVARLTLGLWGSKVQVPGAPTLHAAWSDGAEIVVAGEGGVWSASTTALPLAWTKVVSPIGTSVSPRFTALSGTASELWAVGHAGSPLVYRRGNGGWAPVDVAELSGELVAAASLGEGELLVAARAGAIYRWSGSWQKETLPRALELHALAAAPASANAAPEVWAGGAGGAVCRRDASAAWTCDLIGDGVDVLAVRAFSAGDVWAVGTKGFMAHWDGWAWNRSPTPTFRQLHGVAVVGGATGAGFVAVGAEGTVLHGAGTGALTRRVLGTEDLLAVDGSSLADAKIVSASRVYELAPGSATLPAAGPGEIWRAVRFVPGPAGLLILGGSDVSAWSLQGSSWIRDPALPSVGATSGLEGPALSRYLAVGPGGRVLAFEPSAPYARMPFTVAVPPYPAPNLAAVAASPLAGTVWLAGEDGNAYAGNLNPLGTFGIAAAGTVPLRDVWADEGGAWFVGDGGRLIVCGGNGPSACAERPSGAVGGLRAIAGARGAGVGAATELVAVGEGGAVLHYR